MKLKFGDVVIVEKRLVGVVVKSWNNMSRKTRSHEVYVRSHNAIVEYPESEIERYLAIGKELSDEERGFQDDAMGIENDNF